MFKALLGVLLATTMPTASAHAMKLEDAGTIPELNDCSFLRCQDGVLYAELKEHRFRAYDTTSLELLWETELLLQPEEPGIVDLRHCHPSRIFKVGTPERAYLLTIHPTELLEMDLKTGQILRRYELNGWEHYFAASVSIADRPVLLISTGKGIQVLDAQYPQRHYVLKPEADSSPNSFTLGTSESDMMLSGEWDDERDTLFYSTMTGDSVLYALKLRWNNDGVSAEQQQVRPSEAPSSQDEASAYSQAGILNIQSFSSDLLAVISDAGLVLLDKSSLALRHDLRAETQGLHIEGMNGADLILAGRDTRKDNGYTLARLDGSTLALTRFDNVPVFATWFYELSDADRILLYDSGIGNASCRLVEFSFADGRTLAEYDLGFNQTGIGYCPLARRFFAKVKGELRVINMQ